MHCNLATLDFDGYILADEESENQPAIAEYGDVVGSLSESVLVEYQIHIRQLHDFKQESA